MEGRHATVPPVLSSGGKAMTLMIVLGVLILLGAMFGGDLGDGGDTWENRLDNRR